MRASTRFIAVALLLFASGAGAQSVDKLRAEYLNDPATPETMKRAIENGIVILGMCPFQAFAAAGLPGPYMVKKDKTKWGDGVPPPTIISAQCEYPDRSTIELMFKNKTQFSSSEGIVFRVKFVGGKSVLIDKKGFNEP